MEIVENFRLKISLRIHNSSHVIHQNPSCGTVESNMIIQFGMLTALARNQQPASSSSSLGEIMERKMEIRGDARRDQKLVESCAKRLDWQ